MKSTHYLIELAQNRPHGSTLPVYMVLPVSVLLIPATARRCSTWRGSAPLAARVTGAGGLRRRCQGRARRRVRVRLRGPKPVIAVDERGDKPCERSPRAFKSPFSIGASASRNAPGEPRDLQMRGNDPGAGRWAFAPQAPGRLRGAPSRRSPSPLSARSAGSCSPTGEGRNSSRAALSAPGAAPCARPERRRAGIGVRVPWSSTVSLGASAQS